MKLNCVEQKGDVLFTISSYDKKYIPVFEACFYEKGDGYYYKAFPNSVRFLEKIQANFVNHGLEMFSQLGYFKPVPWEEALIRFIEQVENKNIPWWLTGSCAACVRGIPLNPHDVDIMIDSKDVLTIESLFSEEIFEPFRDTDGWVTKDFGVLFLGARVDVASDPSPVLDDPLPVDCGPYAKGNLETVQWRGHSIKVPPLELQLYVNELRGRKDRAAMIKQHMDERK